MQVIITVGKARGAGANVRACELETPCSNPVEVALVGAALSRGVFQKGSRILDFRVSFDWE